jgi:protein SCO1/2
VDSGVRNTLLVTLALIAMVLGALVASVMLRGPSEDELRSLGYYRQETPRPIADFSMRDDEGRVVSRTDLEGRWSLLFFGFTFCPDICPTTLSVLNEARRRMSEPPNIVMVSVDPDRDTPAVLARYVKSFNPEFAGFTGSFDETVSLAQQLNVAFGKVPGPDPGSYLVDHTASLVVIDPQGRYVGFIKPPHRASNIVAITETFR